MVKALNWINGVWIESATVNESFDPATGKVIGTYADGAEREAEASVAAAVAAFKNSDWKADRHLRARVLNEMADAFAQHTEALIETLSLENGKLKPDARFEIEMIPSKLRFWAAQALSIYGRTMEVEPGKYSMVVRQARGVAAIIAPSNSPCVLLIRSLAPALAAGATCVVKMPGQSAQVSYLMYKIFAGLKSLPKGVINAFSGLHRDGVSWLMTSPDVVCVSYTGSTMVGREIAAVGAATLKRFGMELGGKTPMIVFDDADLDVAVPTLLRALLTFNGQFCVTGSRILAQKGIASKLRDQLAAKLSSLKVGPASDPASELGPVLDKKSLARIDKMVETALSKGAKAIVRGGPVNEGPLAAGAFYKAAMLEIVDNKLDIVQQEIFGPVLTFQVFDTEEEAVQLANDNEYGLAASIWSRDADRPLRVARSIDAGTIWINDWGHIYDEFEEGGFKQSGLGRMNGLSVLDDFLEYKHITQTVGMVKN